MSARATHSNISAFSIAGDSKLAFATSGTLTTMVDTAEGQPINRVYSSPQMTKKSWSFNGSIQSTVSGATRVTNRNVTVFTIGGTSHLAAVESLSINWTSTTDEGSGLADVWKFPVNVGAAISGSVTLKVPVASVPLMASLDGFADHQLAISVTINGVAISFPALITNADHAAQVGQVQRVTLQFVGQDPLTGTFPTAPTGTASMLEKVLNDFQTAVAVAFTSKAAGGVAYSGNAIFTSYSINIPENGVVTEDVTLMGVGELTSTVTV